jgi:hypothetical protein
MPSSGLLYVERKASRGVSLCGVSLCSGPACLLEKEASLASLPGNTEPGVACALVNRCFDGAASPRQPISFTEQIATITAATTSFCEIMDASCQTAEVNWHEAGQNLSCCLLGI